MNFFRSTLTITLFAPLACYLIVIPASVAMPVMAAIPGRAAAQEHHHYKLIVLGTLGGPQSYGDAGHGPANITNQGTAAGVADTAIPDPFYPNFNPNFASLIGLNPFVYHVFVTKGGALVDLGGLFPSGTVMPALSPTTGWFLETH